VDFQFPNLGKVADTMDTGRNRSHTLPSVGRALLGAALLAWLAGGAVRQRLRSEAADEAAGIAHAAELRASVREGQRLEEAAELLARSPAHWHPALRADLERGRARALWAGAWASPVDLRRVAARYEAAPLEGAAAAFVAERSALRFALGRPDPGVEVWEAEPTLGVLDPVRWLAQPGGRWAALRAWERLRAGDAEQAFQRLLRSPTALRHDLTLAAAELAEAGPARDRWIHLAQKGLMNAPLPLEPSAIWRFNRARARHQGVALGAQPKRYGALAALARASDLLAEDPRAAAELAAQVRGSPPGGVPLAVLEGEGLLVAVPLAARVLEARAWRAAGEPELAAAARARAREWAACDPRPLAAQLPELREGP